MVRGSNGRSVYVSILSLLYVSLPPFFHSGMSLLMVVVSIFLCSVTVAVGGLLCMYLCKKNKVRMPPDTGQMHVCSLFPTADSQYQRRQQGYLKRGGGGRGGLGLMGAAASHVSQLERIRNGGGGSHGGHHHHLLGGRGGGAGGGGGTGGSAGGGGIMLTEYNPNYEFGGGSCTLQDLREIPRENLRLVK